ncbi:tryptophan 2,3-dioxygenase family protein [Pseudozobellia thermophila]|uniref:Tryptophan 2,3-dioxygenase n=1 Tax=Pseudozobellia thermophila TaxID=192903 RepID=A0A1M6I7S1_9FLAO|nr:tryptophan 2,3-dioxygenase family protein [Pseudozobellia thermophila]SHJ30456.1 tryptophan 2,3-dioxygenase [Pseudozobellia thermophila]
MSDIGDKIKRKYEDMGENPEAYLEGLLHAKPINYWDYIEVDTLLSLQRPRTRFKDETIFIMYHQVTELLLKMMRHELEQIVEETKLDEAFLLTKLGRINRYTTMLITSFDIMKEGMDYDDYNQFRKTLTPASGFQSVQFRYIEIYCTRLENLINDEGKKRLPPKPSVEDYFEQIYWKDAGLDRKTGKKTLTMQEFEAKYLESLMDLAKKVQGQTLEDKVMQLKDPSDALTEKLREFDRLYNIEWPLVHLRTAEHYLNGKGENKAATGGSEWKKYLHPKYQQRKFFPTLWSEAEKNNWGVI